MTLLSRAAVLVAPGQLEVRELPIPEIGDDDALLRVLACGICGTDLEQYAGDHTSFPTIMGHEAVGVIAAIGETAKSRWRVAEGDRVGVLPRFSCGRCEPCRAGDARTCAQPGLYGFTSTRRPPGLWGGYSQYMYLAPGSRLRKLDRELPLEEAVLFNPLAAGFAWAVNAGGLRRGDDVVILGCGQRGLACVIAAKAAGAGRIVITGLGRDEHKLSVAAKLGATPVNIEEADIVETVRNITEGVGPRVLVDTTPDAAHVVTEAVEMAAHGGTLVLAGLKGSRAVPNLLSDVIVNKELTLKGVRGADSGSFELAASLIESRQAPLGLLHSHNFGLEQTAEALQTLSGHVAGELPISVCIRPDVAS